MVAAIPQAAAAASSTDKTPNLTRPPLLPSEKDHQQNNGSAHIATRKPRGKQVPSRYLSPSPSTSTSTTTTTTTTTSSSSSSSSSFPRRFASPLLSRSTNSGPLHTPLTTTTCSLPSGSKRSQSVDRRRPVTSSRPTTPNPQRTATEISAATKMLITSTRSLSVSFQGEAFSLPISKAKSVTPPQNNVVRKATPERRRATPVRDQGENSRPMDQHRWPGRSREGNLKERNPLLSRSLDCSVVVGGGGDRRVIGSGFFGVKSLQQSIVDEGRRLSLDLGNARQNTDTISVNESSFTGDLTASDSDSVSSGSTSGVPEIGKRKTAPRGITVSARFWQETNSRLRRLQDPGSPLSTSPGSRMGVSPKAIQSKRFSSDGPLSSPRMLAASPIRGATRPASPSKLWTTSASSPSRGMSSPSRATKLYCFVHKVPVCGDCICFPEHQICVVRTYSEWVIDGEYDWPPKCCSCQAVLQEGDGPQTTRLGCLHAIHTNCLVSHIKSFPPHTAPAGYVCPSCSTPIWPPKSVKDSGSRLHSKLKEAIMQTGLEKNLFGNHPISLPAPPPAFTSDPLVAISSSPSVTSETGTGPSKISVSDIKEIESPSSVVNYMKNSSTGIPVATTRKVGVQVERQNSELSYFADDEDGNHKKYSRRGPFRHKFLRALLPFWSSALPTLPVTAPPRKDALNADDASEGRTRNQKHSRMDPRKILLMIAIMACMATMGILYYRIAQRGFGEEQPGDEKQ